MNISLWTVVKDSGALYIDRDDKSIRIEGRTDAEDLRFARALCSVLNSTSIWKLQRTMEELTMAGVPEVY